MATKTRPGNSASEAPGRSKKPSAAFSSFISEFEHSSMLDYSSAVERGVEKTLALVLADIIRFSQSKVASVIGMSPRSFSRLDPKDKLSRQSSDVALRLLRVVVRAIDVFEDEDTARDWLKSPNAALEEHRPVDLVESSFGAQAVLDVLIRIEHGIPA